MRFTFEAYGLELDITFGPADITTPDPGDIVDADESGLVLGAVAVDLTHQGRTVIGFHSDVGGEYVYGDE